VGELVVAKFKDDGSWYRAEVLSISSNGVVCNFVDFGNSDMIPFSSVQRASALCRMIPKVAVKLKLFGDATVRIQYIFKPLCDLDNKKAWLGNMFMPSIIAKYRVEEYVLFDINCAQSFEHLKGLI
jgi:hypothetical protein